MTENTTLIIGGTGKTGRRVLARLEDRGLPVRDGSRSSAIPFDWEDRSTWAPALMGVHAAYVTYFPDLAFPGATEAIRTLASIAAEQGVRRLVLLSGRGEPEAQACERIVQESGLEWTIVRCAFFNQNFSEGFGVEAVRSGTLAFPAGNVAEPFVDADDIADVAVAALTEEGHAGQVYELTGPRLLTFADVAGEISRASGRTVRYVAVSPEEYASMLTGSGMPQELAEALAGLLGEVLDGHNAHLADGVRRALGRQPRDFTEFALSAAGAWKE